MAEKIVWQEIARRGRNHALLLIDLIADAFAKKLVSKTCGISFDPHAYRQFDGGRFFAEDDLNAWIEVLKKDEREKPGLVLGFYLNYERDFNSFRKYSEEIASRDWSGASNEELNAAFRRWCDWFELIMGYAYSYVILNKFYPDLLVASVARKEPDVKTQNELLKPLLVSDKFSEFRLEQQSLVKIVELASELGFGNPKVETLIEEHLKKFRHMGLYYFYQTPFTRDDIITRVKHLLDEGLEKTLQEIESQKKLPAESQRVMRSLNLSESEMLMVKTIKQVAFMTNYFDESSNYVICNCLPFFNEISRRLGISFAQLAELRTSEVEKGLDDGFIPEDLKKDAALRYENSVFLYENGETIVLTGRALEDYYKREKASEETFHHLKELKGQPASPGVVRGIVKIISSVTELGKVQKGDVLVAAATVPAFVPAMERAVAIVTNEGGLLCHAAIVSRELGVPCVVGTKVATKTFRDGDFVEVDATSGVVRKL